MSTGFWLLFILFWILVLLRVLFIVFEPDDSFRIDKHEHNR